ncbi:MAG TPA: helix-turn-helix domain-containing protein, partial [Thermomicrobiales bacterium]|nr:helix-turn-helix domain-containing protein [Thermomicrobiales bacterium]
MFDEMGSFGLPDPEFRQESASVRVTLYNRFRDRQRSVMVDSVPPQIRPLAGELFARGRLTTSEAAALLGVSRPTATRYLNQLAEYGLIERVGAGQTDPTAYWRLR